MTFAKRPLAAPDTLGQRLRQLRQERGLTTDEIGRAIAVAAKYVAAIEDGQYHQLPGLVYARNFVRRYAELMGLNLELAMTRFEDEYRIIRATSAPRRPLLPRRAATDLPWYRRHGRPLLALAAVLVVVVYLGLQVYRLLAPPPLVVSQPASDLKTDTVSIIVRGQTEPEVTVTINGQLIDVRRNGTFAERVDLHVGLNTLRIAAAKKHSGERVIMRQVLVE